MRTGFNEIGAIVWNVTTGLLKVATSYVVEQIGCVLRRATALTLKLKKEVL